MQEIKTEYKTFQESIRKLFRGDFLKRIKDLFSSLDWKVPQVTAQIIKRNFSKSIRNLLQVRFFEKNISIFLRVGFFYFFKLGLESVVGTAQIIKNIFKRSIKNLLRVGFFGKKYKNFLSLGWKLSQVTVQIMKKLFQESIGNLSRVGFFIFSSLGWKVSQNTVFSTTE